MPMATVRRRTDTPQDRFWRRVYACLTGLATLGVVLQGAWAGVFLEHDGRRDAAASWIDVHARGADVCIVLVAAAAGVAFLRLRHRRDLWLGAGGLTLLLWPRVTSAGSSATTARTC